MGREIGNWNLRKQRERKWKLEFTVQVRLHTAYSFKSLLSVRVIWYNSTCSLVVLQIFFILCPLISHPKSYGQRSHNLKIEQIQNHRSTSKTKRYEGVLSYYLCYAVAARASGRQAIRNGVGDPPFIKVAQVINFGFSGFSHSLSLSFHRSNQETR
jgi:hypothetical protein